MQNNVVIILATAGENILTSLYVSRLKSIIAAFLFKIACVIYLISLPVEPVSALSIFFSMDTFQTTGIDCTES